MRPDWFDSHFVRADRLREFMRRRIRPEKPLVVREPAPELQPDTALAQLVRETRERGIHVEAWTVRGGSR